MNDRRLEELGFYDTDGPPPEPDLIPAKKEPQSDQFLEWVMRIYGFLLLTIMCGTILVFFIARMAYEFRLIFRAP